MKKLAFLLVVLCLSITGLFAEDTAPRIISSIEVVQNDPVRTRPGSLLNWIDLTEGQVFGSAAELTAAVEKEVQDLKNTRYFAEAAMDVSEGPAGADGSVPVDIVVTISDAWTLLPIPYPLPDSQIGKNGWAFGVEINYNNFLGTMTDFYMDSNMKFAFGEAEKLRAWKIEPELRNVKMGNLIFDFKLKQQYEIKRTVDETDVLIQQYSFYTSQFGVATDIEFGTDWTYGFEPTLKFNYGYDWSTGERTVFNSNTYVDPATGKYYNREDPFSFTFEHFIRQGAIDWEQTFRRGYELELSNQNQFNISRAAEKATANEFLYIPDFNLAASYYLPFAKVLNYYTKGQALVVFNEIRTGLGEDVRGVKDSSMFGNMAFFWQNTLVIQPHKPNTKFNFQFHPFFDVGMAFDYNNVQAFGDMIRMGVGTELVAMLGGIDLRARIGLDPINFGDTGFLDFSFGTGLTY